MLPRRDDPEDIPDRTLRGACWSDGSAQQPQTNCPLTAASTNPECSCGPGTSIRNTDCRTPDSGGTARTPGSRQKDHKSPRTLRSGSPSSFSEGPDDGRPETESYLPIACSYRHPQSVSRNRDNSLLKSAALGLTNQKRPIKSSKFSSKCVPQADSVSRTNSRILSRRWWR